MRNYSVPIESDEYPGFYLVPGVERLVVSKQGQFIDILLRYCFIPTVSDHMPYPSISIKGGKTYFCHRLVAKTFLICPGDENTFVVNHLDGDKLNSSVNNLEWCTSSQNATHAYESGLRNDNTPIEVIDLREENPLPKRYYSMQACARAFSVNAEAIHRWLNNNQLVPFKKFYNLRYVSDDWRPLTNADIGRIQNGAPKIIVGYNGDNVVHIFESYGMAARHVKSSIYNINRHALTRSVVPIEGFLFRYLDDFDGREEMLENAVVFKLPQSKPPVRKPIPILVTDLKSGITESMDSVETFSIVHGVKKNTVQKAMLKNNNVWKGYKIEYQSPIPQ